MDKKIIGRIDIVDFPSLRLEGIPVKIDTGAYTSSIHCSRIKEKTIDGKTILSFHLLDPDCEGYTGEEIVAEDYSISQVKSSTGHIEERFVIHTLINLFDNTFLIELTLSDRGEMRFPVLLGRKILKSNFIVDVAEKNMSYKSRN